MIVRIARVKVGNRQAPHARTPAQHGGGFAFYRPRRASSSSLPAFRSSAIPRGALASRRALLDARRSTLGAETLRSTASLRPASVAPASLALHGALLRPDRRVTGV